MKLDQTILDDSEKLMLALRALYLRHGFAHYRMGKFEEYDLYVRNKDFLISDNIITFTDTDGKLMALKPDVTLSLIKSRKDEPDTLQKLCYNENVYRVSKGAGSFRELMQAGVECIGAVDDRCVGETLLLAAESLALCGSSFVLETSQLDILRRFLCDISEDDAVRQAALKCVSEKNAHGISELCRASGVAREKEERLLALLGVGGRVRDALPALEALCAGQGLDRELAHLRSVLAAAEGSSLAEHIRLDFSCVSNMNYYNGVLFKGFIEGIPGSVLSGGQYDKLMRKMGKRSKAVGFAVYLDMLERLGDTGNAVPAFADD